jgi:hypothetical protein
MKAQANTVERAGAEQQRLAEVHERGVPWRKWGPYLSERQWGTVREDYSEDGNAWDYFSHDQARSRAYHWGEDGLAGFSDDKQHLCFAVALWNGRDPILKERLFGLTNSEGNHGEDVKEYYFYLDSTPTHSYMKWLYKYPQAAYPYGDLIESNKRRNRGDMEYELLDTGVFNGDRYFDVFVEYAKQAPEDILIQISVCNRGPEPATLHVLPTLWFRNIWTWWPGTPKPVLKQATGSKASQAVAASHTLLGERYLYCEGDVPLLFTENETNNERIFGTPNTGPYVKDGINNYVVNGKRDAVNPQNTGTKAAAHYQVDVGAGKTATIRLRLSDMAPAALGDPFDSFTETMRGRQREADEFYRAITPERVSEDGALVMRQALGGMLWSKQYFGFDVDKWLEEHGVDPLRPGGKQIRNREWFHMVNDHIISMPDKWEYPWYAAWDLAFHTIALSTVDVDFAKGQLDLMLQEFFLHPTGQIPAYEWNFSDVNPPVHAWATIFMYRTEQVLKGEADLEFLRRSFAKLMLNFSWWVNRKDRFGKNLFEGGFLGLDNIGVFDRSAPLPTGGHLEQADGTAWVTLFCQNMLEISMELAAHDSFYEDMAVKFADHVLWIARAMNQTGPDGMWDEEDGFYYDVLRLPDGKATRLKVRSMVGCCPCVPRQSSNRGSAKGHRERCRFCWNGCDACPNCSRAFIQPGLVILGTPIAASLRWLIRNGCAGFFRTCSMRTNSSVLMGYGAISRYHAEHPYVFNVDGQEYRVNYLPAESDTGMFGGNSNWRGPIWMPVNALLIRALMSFYLFYGDNFKIECPTGSGRSMNLFEVAREIANRLAGIFLRDRSGRRPVHGGTEKFQTDPRWKDYILFYEYFHGDNGAGLGASHQTGRTGVVAKLIELFGHLDGPQFLEAGKAGAFTQDPVKR